MGPSEQRFRTYHSIALLLPDGSVLSAGDDLHEDQDRPDDTWLGSAEIYRPPYLFKGARPAIGAAPANVRGAQSFAVSTPDGASIDHAVLMAPSATTHGADMTERYVRLRVTGRTDGQGVTLAGPANPNVVPPGYYMLFLVNARDVPSKARWVRVLPRAAPRPPGRLDEDGPPWAAVLLGVSAPVRWAAVPTDSSGAGRASARARGAL